jgi:hypothetical protein
MPRPFFLRIRVSKSERDQLHVVARQNGKTLSGFIRSLTQQPMESNLIKKG